MPGTSINGGANAQQNTATGTPLGSAPPYVAPTNTTINSSSIAPATPISLPPQPPASNGAAANASIPSPVTAQSIIDQGTQATPAEGQQNALLQQIAALTGGQSSLATQQSQAENSAGLPALSKTVNDLTAKLNGLSDQATALGLQSSPGGTNETNVQSNFSGGRASVGFESAATQEMNRQTNIQQAGIAAQALTTKSALYAAQGSYTMAKNAADQAAQVAFDAQTQEINHYKASLAAIQPQLTKEQSAQTLLIQSQLADRQNQITQQQSDFKTGQAMAIAAMQNNPNDKAAQYNAQQALQVSPTDPQYIQKVAGLVAQYQKDPIAAQTAIANLAKTRADAQLAQYNAAAAAPITPNDPSAKAALDPNSQSILAQTGLSVAAFNFLTQGTSALSRLSSADRQRIMNESNTFLNKAGLDYSTFQSQYKAQNQVVQQNIERAANTKVFGGEVSGTVSQFVNDVGSGIANLKPAAVTELFAKGQTNDPTAQKYAFDLQTMQNDLAGYYAASRGSNSPDQADLNAAANVITNGLSAKGATAFKQSIDANIAKVSGVVNDAVTNAQQSVWTQFGVGDKYQGGKTATASTINAGGKTFNVGQTYQDASGAKWSVDASGKWTKQ